MQVTWAQPIGLKRYNSHTINNLNNYNICIAIHNTSLYIYIPAVIYVLNIFICFFTVKSNITIFQLNLLLSACQLIHQIKHNYNINIKIRLVCAQHLPRLRNSLFSQTFFSNFVGYISGVEKHQNILICIGSRSRSALPDRRNAVPNNTGDIKRKSSADVSINLQTRLNETHAAPISTTEEMSLGDDSRLTLVLRDLVIVLNKTQVTQRSENVSWG